MPDGWASYTLDNEWRMRDVSAELVEMLGVDPEGMILWELFPQGVGAEFWDAAHYARETGRSVWNRSTYPVHGMTCESLTVPDGDLLHVTLRRIDLHERCDRVEAQISRLVDAVALLTQQFAPEPPPRRRARLAIAPSGQDENRGLRCRAA